MSAFAIFLVFSTLILGTLADRDQARQLRRKTRAEWVLDCSGLFVQGTLIPILEATAIIALYAALLPGLRGALRIPAGAAFLLNFVVVDYLYYWNHRLLHGRRLWVIHRVHHTVRAMDVVGTSRNTLWSSFFILYLWVNALFAYLLADPTPFLLGAAVTAMLDLWRHSALGPRPGSWLERLLAPVLVLPADHAWHHGRDTVDQNFGANLKLWDRLHGTLHPWDGDADLPALGVPSELDLVRSLLWPFPR